MAQHEPPPFSHLLGWNTETEFTIKKREQQLSEQQNICIVVNCQVA